MKHISLLVLLSCGLIGMQLGGVHVHLDELHTGNLEHVHVHDAVADAADQPVDANLFELLSGAFKLTFLALVVAFVFIATRPGNVQPERFDSVRPVPIRSRFRPPLRAPPLA